MLIRVAAPSLVGVLALGGLAAAPAAFASTAVKPTIDKASATSMVFGTTGTTTFTFSTTVSDDSGIKNVKVTPWPKGVTAPTAGDAGEFAVATCKASASSAKTSVCTYTVKTDVRKDFDNTVPGTWYVAALVTGKDGGTAFAAKAATFTIKRQDKLTVADGTPEPVKKNATLTVASKLTRANWDTYTWQGYGKQSVKLQFLKSGTKTWTNVKTVSSSTTGAIKTTVKATASGSWRFVFAGNSVSSAATSAADAVTVK
ncbi:DUF5707 domain-containing protein [Actinacidiphila oryziradicis]|uniref:Calcium-binding protein n=1 Tax=Actinacidiphila oryziradicis TaxID=2571141 RepID=A0A4U0SS48_9ACTN|nr:DUF5707 domain-containing protein [Actinacidiphila oryziradicis]TKA11181.1 calcium-binding protein [Actinacidiphila oryziradicis]